MFLSGKRAGALALDAAHDLAGGVLFALGIYTFAGPANFAPGGVSGLALIMTHLWGIPVGTATLLLNIPILLVSFRAIGRRLLLHSLRTMVVVSVLLDLVFPHFPVYTGSRLLAAGFAGVLTGAGMGLIYLRGSSTGGMDFLNLAAKKCFPHLSLGRIMLVTDAAVVLLGGLVFRDIDAVLYGIVFTFATSTVLDRILCGADGGKLALIITRDGRATARLIGETIERGATLIPAIGAYSDAARDLLLCVCGKSQIVKVRQAAYAIDPDAFMTVTDASEVLGEGFKAPTGGLLP